MQNKNSQQEIFCAECGSLKETRYCNVCKGETANLFKQKLPVITTPKITGRNLMKSREKIGNKPKREVEQWLGNKDKNVISEIERLREEAKPTKVIHRLWRKIENIYKKVHEHKKIKNT
jgi:hypothetical protein